VPISASSAAMTRSAHRAMSDPPPTHQPCTCATTGFGLRHRLMICGTGPVNGLVTPIMSLPGSQRPSVLRRSFQCASPSEKSKPAQNARPAPRSTMTRTASSRFAIRTAASISAGIGGTIVFKRSGRSRVMAATAPWVS
jgi:hypothetical protein